MIAKQKPTTAYSFSGRKDKYSELVIILTVKRLTSNLFENRLKLLNSGLDVQVCDATEAK